MPASATFEEKMPLNLISLRMKLYIHPRRLLRRQSEVPVSPSVPAPRRVRKSPLSFDTIFRQRARRFTTLRRWDQKRMRANTRSCNNTKQQAYVHHHRRRLE
ncbi:unnamed protein product [Brassica oleracea]|uniref:(rape) hypothetical protein n=1 Tax=Brassica napus TaxID=3708 RepID=A0A816LDY5_BRANA|nr:unnamed protein product [Brassica napus]